MNIENEIAGLQKQIDSLKEKQGGIKVGDYVRCALGNVYIASYIDSDGDFYAENREGSCYWFAREDLTKITKEEYDAKQLNCYGLNSEGNITSGSKENEADLNAILTLRKLRACKGVEPKVDDVLQWVIRPIGVNDWEGINNKLNLISPAYETKQAALDAVELIGKEEINKMFKAFGGIYE